MPQFVECFERPLSILVIDDEADAHLRLQSLLHECGFTLKTLQNIYSAKALESAKIELYDFAFVNLELRDGTAISIMEALANKNYRLPCVVLTTHESIETFTQASNLGVFDYLVKGELTVHNLQRCIFFVLKRIEIQQALVDAKNEAEHSADLQKTFLANMSHEIRTPLTSIIGNIQLLRDTELTPSQHRLIGQALTSSDILLSLINDILDLSKVEAGKMELEEREFSLSKCIDECIEVLQGKAGAKDIQLYAFFDAAIPLLIGDSARLRQVFLNLINNAIKFTDKGYVRIFANLKKPETKAPTIEITIEDSGIGISEENQKHLFRKFAQADSSTNRKYGGSGLGLFISKSLIEQMHGQVSVTSTVGKGSTFHLSLPLAHSRADTKTGTFLKNTSVGIVSPANAFAATLTQQLKTWGAAVTLFPSWNEVCKTLKPPTIILHLLESVPVENDPDIDLRKRKLPDSMKRICVGPPGVKSKGLNDRCKAMGYSRFLGQPFTLGRFHLLFEQMMDPAAGAELPIPQRRASDPKPNLQRNILLAEDTLVNQILIVEILKTYGCTCKVAANGVEAVELFQKGGIHMVLMDCHMPQMDGYTATRTIRGLETKMKIPRIPIVALTASPLSETRKECLESGMDDVLTKPLDIVALVGAIQKFTKGAVITVQAA